jgi:hypothetical protein
LLAKRRVEYFKARDWLHVRYNIDITK